MSKLPIAFASNDPREIKKVLKVLGLTRINLDKMGNSESRDFLVSVDGMMVRGTIGKIQNYEVPAFHIGFIESDIDELIGDHISEKSGVPVLDTTRIEDDAKIKSIFSRAIHEPAGSHEPAPPRLRTHRRRSTRRKTMRRTASEILSDLEIRIAHLERKQMRFDEDFATSSSLLLDRGLKERKRSHFRAFKKGLTEFLVKLDGIAEGEYGLEDLGLGDGFLSRVEGKSEHYYSKAVQKLFSSTGLSREEATLENYLRNDNIILNRLTYPEGSIGGLIAHALKEIFRGAYIEGGNKEIISENKEIISEIASDLLGVRVTLR